MSELEQYVVPANTNPTAIYLRAGNYLLGCTEQYLPSETFKEAVGSYLLRQDSPQAERPALERQQRLLCLTYPLSTSPARPPGQITGAVTVLAATNSCRL